MSTYYIEYMGGDVSTYDAESALEGIATASCLIGDGGLL